MNEVALSNDLNVITAEINSYKQVAGHSFVEIGKRLIHVKENNLTHGDWKPFLENIQMSKSQADRFMKVAKEYEMGKLPHVGNIGFRALYEIATLPTEQRDQAFNNDGSAKTIKEIQELKQKNRQLEQEKQRAERSNEKLGQLLTEERNKQPETIERQVVKEVVPEHVKQQLQEKDRFLKAMKNETETLQEELKILKLQQGDGTDDALDEQKLKRLEREASIETLEIAIRIQRFLKDSSLSAFQIGALAQSSDSTKAKMHQHIEMLEQFTQNLKSALNGRIQI